MSSLKLKGATSGESIIKAPAVAGTDTTFTLPKASLDLSTAGTDGQFLKTDGAGTLSFATVASVGGGTGVDLNDSVKTRWGTDNDLEIYHDNSNSYIKHANNGSLEIDATSSGHIILKPDGEVKVSNDRNLKVDNGNLIIGTSGKGIDFSATTDANNGAYGGTKGDELLHDYEYGTWTPVLKFNGGTTGQSYTTQDGRYTKIGNVVTIQANIDVQDKGSSTGNITMGGLPWLAKSAGGILAIMGGGFAFSGTSNYVLVGTNANHYWAEQMGGDGNSANIDYHTHASINNGYYYITGSYIAAD